MDRSHAVISSEGQQQTERRGGGGTAGVVDARKEGSSSSSAWKQGNPRIVHPSVTSPVSTSISTFSNLTSNLTTRFSAFVASPSSSSTSTTSPRLDSFSSSSPGSVPSAFPSSTEGSSSSTSAALVWSAFDDLPASSSSTEMAEGGGLQGRTSSRVLLKASSQELSIWSAPDSPSGAAKELVRISGKGRLEWGGGSSQIVGAKILGGERKTGALRVVILLDTDDGSALVVHSLETLEVLDSTTLTGQAGELKATESFIVVGTTRPSQLHILSSTNLAPHSAPITTVALNPTTNQPTFTLSHRFLSYASSFAPPKSMPPIVRLGGDAGEPAGVLRKRESTLSPSKVVGTLGGLILGGPGGSKGRGRDQGAGVEGTLVDVAGRFVSGGAAAGREGMRKVGNLVAGFAATSVSTTATSTSEAASTSPSPPSPPPLTLDRTPTSPQPQQTSRLPPRPPQDNSIAIVDLLSSNPTTPSIHFYLHPSTSPTREQVNFLSLSPSGRQLLVAQVPFEFNVLEIRPKGRGSTAGGGEVWERYVLRRGVTPGVVRGVEWERDEMGVGVLSGRGTIHVYLLNPQGGSPSGHLHGKVVNSKLLAPFSTIVQPIIQVRPQVDSTQVFNNNASRNHRRTSSSDFAAPPPSNIFSSTFAPPTNFFFLPTSPPSLLHSPKPSTTSGRRLSSPSHNHQHLPPLPTPSIAKDLLIFQSGRDILRLHRAVLGAKSGSSSSGLSLMLSQTNSVAGGGGGRVPKEVVVVESETTVARWELGGTGEEGGEVRMGKKTHGSSSSVVSPRRRDASSSSTDQDRARWLSHVEIETSSSSFKILPSPIWLSPQFEFHVFDTTTALPDFSPRQPGSLLTERLIVRNEVQVSSSSSNQLSSLSGQIPSLSIPSSFTNSNTSVIGSPAFSLERFPSCSSRRSSSSHSHSQSFSPGSFDASLETAIHTSLGPLHPRSRSIVPSYPNGDGPTTSPRSWKSTTVPLAGLLGEGMDRFRKEVGRVSSSTANKPRSKAPSSSSLPNQASFNVLSFEEGTIYDENDFASARSSGGGGGGGKFSSSSAEGSGPSSSSFEEEQWEEEDDPEEAYRKVIEEEEGYEDLIVGVMDDVGGGRVAEKVEVEKKVELEVERELQVAREEQQETVRPKKKGENKKRGKVSTSPMGSVGEEMKHSEVGSGKE